MLISCLISAVVFLIEKIIIQIVSVDYHRRQYESRILANKEGLRFLASLYEVSRNLFPEFEEFAAEDYIIRQGMFKVPGSVKKSGNATPMRALAGQLNVAQGRVVSMFGGVAQEIAGNKNIFNANNPYNVVIDAMQRRSAAEALAKRIWMSFVPENSTALTKSDLLEVMGEDQKFRAEQCFESLDEDGNGDVSLDEMLLHVNKLYDDRRDTAKSMRDVVSNSSFERSFHSILISLSRIMLLGLLTTSCSSSFSLSSSSFSSSFSRHKLEQPSLASVPS